MTRFMHYPGDPICPVELLTGASFKRANPNRTITIRGWDEPESTATVIPVPDVICDHCNAQVGDDDFCAVTMNRLYCRACWYEWIEPYLLPEEK